MSGGMLIQATQDDKQRILGYLHPDLGNCIYIYMDVDVYSIGEDIDVWIQQESSGSILLVVMRYADCLQVYARESDAEMVAFKDVATIAKALDINRIHGPKWLIEALGSEITGGYEEEYGWVIELVWFRPLSIKGIEAVEAGVDDAQEIAELIVSCEELGTGYSSEILASQIAERIKSGMGRHFIVRRDGRIIAHDCFSAITDEFVIGAYAVASPESDGSFVGQWLEAYMVNEMIAPSGKRGFAFVEDYRRVKLFERMGNPIIGEFGKLLKQGL